MWNTMFFQKTTLCDLGLQVQLGHTPGIHCPTSECGNQDFVVIHMNGIHMVGVDFCRCQLIPHHKQLLRIAWWPKTPINPKTCVTMECLWQFHLLNLKANVTTFGYYGTLRHMTDNLGLEQIPVSYCSHCVESILITVFRISSMPLRSWHVNSDIPRCSNATCVHMILEAYWPWPPVLLLSLAELVPFLISIYHGAGMMFSQKERKYFYLHMIDACIRLQVALYTSIGHGCKLPAQK